jgi:hypothetical protein
VRLTTGGDWIFLLAILDNHGFSDKDHRGRLAFKGELHQVPPTISFGFDGSNNYWLITVPDAQDADEQLGRILPPDSNPAQIPESIYSGLHPLGQRGGVVINSGVTNALTTLEENAIWFFAGHGLSNLSGYSYIVFFDAPLTRDMLFNLNLGRLRTCVFAACETAKGDGYGASLLDEVMNRGARSCVAFEEVIGDPQARYWAERFWYYTTKKAKAVTAAANFAVEDTVDYFGSSTGAIESMKSQSVGAVVLCPAAWGQ